MKASGAGRESPQIRAEMLDPVGLAWHRRVDADGYTVDTVRTAGTSVPHRHRGIELFFVHAGAAILHVGDWSTVARPGDVVLFDGQGSFHATRSVHGQYVRTVLHFLPDAVDRGFRRRLAGLEAGPRRVTMPPSTAAHLFHNLRRLKAVESGRRLSASATALLGDILGAVEVSGSRDQGADPMVQAILTHMGRSPSGTGSLMDLSKQFFVSEGHLCYLFRFAIGCSPQRLWRLMTIQHLCCRLASDPRSVGKLADAAGFGSRSGFQRAFRRVTGLSVADYYRRIQARAAAEGRAVGRAEGPASDDRSQFSSQGVLPI